MNALFCRFARATALAVAHPVAFMLAVLTVVVWAATGPMLHYSENWQLIINTGTTILTFLMVFLLQNTQNRDSRAVQVKLDELIRAISGARNEMIDLENLSDEELTRYCEEFQLYHVNYAKELKERGKKLPDHLEPTEAAVEHVESKPPIPLPHPKRPRVARRSKSAAQK